MSRTEITVAQYKLCVEAGGCAAPRVSTGCNYGDPTKLNHPMNCIGWDAATAYAAWLDIQIPDVDVRLPSEAEWEFAARSGGQANRLAWGDQPIAEVCELGNVRDCGHTETKRCFTLEQAVRMQRRLTVTLLMGTRYDG